MVAGIISVPIATGNLMTDPKNQSAEDCIVDIEEAETEKILVEAMLLLIPNTIAKAIGDGFFYVTDSIGNMIEAETAEVVRSWTAVGALIERCVLEEGYFRIEHKVLRDYVMPEGETALAFTKACVDGLTKPQVIMPN